MLQPGLTSAAQALHAHTHTHTVSLCVLMHLYIGKHAHTANNLVAYALTLHIHTYSMCLHTMQTYKCTFGFMKCKFVSMFAYKEKPYSPVCFFSHVPASADKFKWILNGKNVHLMLIIKNLHNCISLEWHIRQQRTFILLKCGPNSTGNCDKKMDFNDVEPKWILTTRLQQKAFHQGDKENARRKEVTEKVQRGI